MVTARLKTVKIITTAIVIALLVFILLSVLGNTLTKELGRDEQMYCTAGYLTAQSRLIYRDFSYVAQMPYHPLLCAGLYKLFDTNYYLLTARLLSFFCEAVIIVCIVGIYRRVFGALRIRGLLTGAAAAGLYVLNEYVDYSAGYAWNHSFVSACVMGTLWLSFGIDFDKPYRRRLFLSGALLTAATFTRPTTILILAAFGVMLLLRKQGRILTRLKFVLPFIVGVAVLSIWPMSVIIRSGQAFWLCVLRIPELNAQFLYDIGMTRSKIGLTVNAMLSPSYFILIATGVILFVLLLKGRTRFMQSDKSNAIFAVVIAAMFVFIAFIPPTMWRQYLAGPVAFILVGFAYPLAYICRGRQVKIIGYWLAVGLIVCLWYRPSRFVVRVGDVFDCEKWAPVQVHKISQQIYAEASGDKLALTLSPLYAIEGGCEIYPELSAGPFVYRVADRLTEQQRQITHTVGLSTLDTLLRKRQPSVVICAEPMQFLAESLIAQSGAGGWRREVYGKSGPVVFFRRAAQTSRP